MPRPRPRRQRRRSDAAPPPVPADVPPPVSPDDPTTVYIDGLTWWTTDVDIRTYCAEYGTVKSCVFFAEKSNGKSKGTVCVEFEEPRRGEGVF